MNTSTSGSSSEQERRGYTRHPYPETIQVNNGKMHPARSVNLSYDGIGLEIPNALSPGFDLEVIFLNGAVRAPAKVEYCNRLPGNEGYRAGLRFENLEEDLVSVLIDMRKKFMGKSTTV